MKALALVLGLTIVSLGAIGLMAGRSGAVTPTMAAQWNLQHTCTFCHDPHGGPLNHNLWDEDIEVLCLTCHGPAGVSTLKAATHDVGGYSFTCMDCHDYHKHLDNWLGGENLKMVGHADAITGLAVINTQTGPVDVVFESLGTGVGQPSLHSFADYDEDGNGIRDGVCEVCHVQAGFPSTAPPGGYLQAKESFAGRTCTECHAHVDGFLK